MDGQINSSYWHMDPTLKVNRTRGNKEEYLLTGIRYIFRHTKSCAKSIKLPTPVSSRVRKHVAKQAKGGGGHS